MIILGSLLGPVSRALGAALQGCTVRGRTLLALAKKPIDLSAPVWPDPGASKQSTLFTIRPHQPPKYANTLIDVKSENKL